MLRGRGVLALAAVVFAAAVPGAGAQSIEVSQAFVDLPTPDLAAYDAERSLSVSFTVTVTACGAVAGCEMTLENPQVASVVPIDLEWRVLDVSQAGDGDAGCLPSVALSVWQPLGSIPEPTMETATVAGDVACVATIETRAQGLSWSVHEYTTPATTYWRDLTFRVSER